jgi:hypothetical protein
MVRWVIRTHEHEPTISAESTLARVQNFSWFIIFSFVGLGVWQILHLRSFFKRKYLID